MRRFVSILLAVAVLVASGWLLLLGHRRSPEALRSAQAQPGSITETNGAKVAPPMGSRVQMAVPSAPMDDRTLAAARQSIPASDRSGIKDPLKRTWDPNFLDSLRELAAGKAIQFELVGGTKAAGKISRWERSGDELTSISGQLSEPEAGRRSWALPMIKT